MKINRLTILDEIKLGKVLYLEVLCDCGTLCTKRKADVLLQKTKSCGCLNRERVKAMGDYYGKINGKIQKHGHSISANTKSPTYRSWLSMKDRCNNPKMSNYKWYGGKGIKVCDRWQHSFENFLTDMGERPNKDYTIDRIDPDRDYEPTNCRWLHKLENIRRRHNANVSNAMHKP